MQSFGFFNFVVDFRFCSHLEDNDDDENDGNDDYNYDPHHKQCGRCRMSIVYCQNFCVIFKVIFNNLWFFINVVLWIIVLIAFSSLTFWTFWNRTSCALNWFMMIQNGDEVVMEYVLGSGSLLILMMISSGCGSCGWVFSTKV